MTKTNKILISIFVSIVILFIVKLISNKAQNKQPTSEIKTTKSQQNLFQAQENEGGNVTVSVKPKTLKIGEKPEFETEFNTHSVDLSFDITKQSFLTDDKGNRLEGSTWNGSPPGGHHREGTLIFNDPLSETKYVEFIIEDIAGVSERKFKWEL